MARKSSYCKSGNKNINWHPTKVFLEDFWAIIFQKLCMNFLGLAPLHCKSLNHPEQSVSLFILGQNLFNPRTFKKMARHSVEKTSGILSDMVCPQEIAKHVNARKLHWYRSPPVFTQNSQCPKVGPTASSPKIVCEAACEMTGTAGTDTTGTTLPNHPRTSDSVWICWVELSEIATGLLLPYSSKFSSRVYSKMFEDVCLFYMKTQS